jgi:hypothetical protein
MFALNNIIEGHSDEFMLEGGLNNETKHAMMCRTTQKQIGCPCDHAFKNAVSTRKNYTSHADDIAISNSITVRRNRNKLTGAATRQQSNGVVRSVARDGLVRTVARDKILKNKYKPKIVDPDARHHVCRWATYLPLFWKDRVGDRRGCVYSQGRATR